MLMYKSDPSTGEIFDTLEVSPEEHDDALKKGWWETPRWRVNPRPNGLSNDNIYEKRVDTPYQEFPRTLHKAGKTITVRDTKEKEAKLKAGWSLVPAPESVEVR